MKRSPERGAGDAIGAFFSRESTRAICVAALAAQTNVGFRYSRPSAAIAAITRSLRRV
jgi:hypothetical protein